jgi:hypothetical protein
VHQTGPLTRIVRYLQPGTARRLHDTHRRPTWAPHRGLARRRRTAVWTAHPYTPDQMAVLVKNLKVPFDQAPTRDVPCLMSRVAFCHCWLQRLGPGQRKIYRCEPSRAWNPKVSFIVISEILVVNVAGIEHLTTSLIRSLGGPIFLGLLGNFAGIKLVASQSSTPA